VRGLVEEIKVWYVIKYLSEKINNQVIHSLRTAQQRPTGQLRIVSRGWDGLLKMALKWEHQALKREPQAPQNLQDCCFETHQALQQTRL
jgi:hypothetical protein